MHTGNALHIYYMHPHPSTAGVPDGHAIPLVMPTTSDATSHVNLCSTATRATHPIPASHLHTDRKQEKYVPSMVEDGPVVIIMCGRSAADHAEATL